MAAVQLTLPWLVWGLAGEPELGEALRGFLRKGADGGSWLPCPPTLRPHAQAHNPGTCPPLLHPAAPTLLPSLPAPQCQLLVEVIDAELEEELQEGSPASRLSLTQARTAVRGVK